MRLERLTLLFRPADYIRNLARVEPTWRELWPRLLNVLAAALTIAAAGGIMTAFVPVPGRALVVSALVYLIAMLTLMAVWLMQI